MGLLATATDFQRHAHEVGCNGGVVPRPNIQLWVGRLRSDLQVGIAQGVSNGVNADQSTSAEKVDPLKVTGSRGVQLSPLTVDIPGQEIKGVQRLLGCAARRQPLHGGSGAVGGRKLDIL